MICGDKKFVGSRSGSQRIQTTQSYIIIRALMVNEASEDMTVDIVVLVWCGISPIY